MQECTPGGTAPSSTDDDFHGKSADAIATGSSGDLYEKQEQLTKIARDSLKRLSLAHEIEVLLRIVNEKKQKLKQLDQRLSVATTLEQHATKTTEEGEEANVQNSCHSAKSKGSILKGKLLSRAVSLIVGDSGDSEPETEDEEAYESNGAYLPGAEEGSSKRKRRLLRALLPVLIGEEKDEEEVRKKEQDPQMKEPSSGGDDDETLPSKNSSKEKKEEDGVPVAEVCQMDHSAAAPESEGSSVGMEEKKKKPDSLPVLQTSDEQNVKRTFMHKCSPSNRRNFINKASSLLCLYLPLCSNSTR